MKTLAVLGCLIGFFAVAVLVWWWFQAGSSSPRAPEDPPWFQDITERSQLHFTHDAGPFGKFFMPQSLGSGGALLDIDGDGRLDAYLLHNGGPTGAANQLFRQLPDGRFQDVSKGSGLDFAGYCIGAAVGDVNNDGLPDVLVTEYHGARLFLNRGGNVFQDISQQAGIDNPAWGTSAAFFDYDRDGWLDLAIVNYVVYNSSIPCANPAGRPDFCAPHRFPGTVTKLFHNLGVRSTSGRTEPRFEDVTLASGLGRSPGPGLGVTCADFDGDGWPDLFVANDGKPNHLWINGRDGTFKEEALMRGVAYNILGQPQANMGVALSDVDGDGALDLYVTHVVQESPTLWHQEPRGLFQDRTAAAGLASPRWPVTGFGTVLADFDHDASVDLAVVAGDIHITDFGKPDAETVKALGPLWSLYAQRNQLFINDGTGHFRDISRHAEPFCATAAVSRGLVWGDVDNDGAIDLLVTSIAGPARLYRNVAPKRGHWLMIRVLDPARRRDAYGAEVRVEAGSRRWIGLVNPAQSYLCSGDARVHFGLGKAERVDRIRIRWPDGSKEDFPGAGRGSVDLAPQGRRTFGPSMTDMPSQEPQVTARRAAWRFRCFAVLATVLLVTGIGISVYWLRSSPASPPPLVDLTETDPAVAAVVKAARERVLAAPRSGQAWGHLGKVLLANEYYREAQICLARAEQLDPRNPRWPYFQAGINPANNPQAIAKLRRTIELCGDEPLTPQLRLAETLLAEGQVEEASKLFDRILSSVAGEPLGGVGSCPRIVRARRLAPPSNN